MDNISILPSFPKMSIFYSGTERDTSTRLYLKEICAMRRLVLGLVWVAALATVGLVPVVSDACHRRGCCESYCGSAPCAVPCAPVAAPAPTFEERKVTYLKPVWKERVVEEVIVRCVPRQEKFFYEACVPTSRVEKRIVSVCKPVMREVETIQKVAVPIRTIEKRKVVCNVPVTREVEFTYTALIPRTREVPRTVTYCDYETRVVETTVPVCCVVPVTCTDACGRCYTTCRTVTEYRKCARTVCVPIPKTKEILVRECYYDKELRKGVRTVCDYRAEERWIEVPVCRYEYKDVPCRRMVCETVMEKREVAVTVCDIVREKREGVRTVVDRVPEKVTRKVRVCEYETVTETVRVPVCVPACYTPCDSCGRVGLFGRHRGCCN